MSLLITKDQETQREPLKAIMYNSVTQILTEEIAQSQASPL